MPRTQPREPLGDSVFSAEKQKSGKMLQIYIHEQGISFGNTISVSMNACSHLDPIALILELTDEDAGKAFEAAANIQQTKLNE